MKINGLQVDNFGVWNDLTIGDLPDDLTVFYGPNEAGKSTLMNFVRTILFGFSPEKCQRFLTGPFGQQRRRMGGRLRVQGYEGQFYIQRYADEADPVGEPGDARVTTVDNRRVGGHKLASLLSGIDEAIYNNVFCLGMGEIQQLSTLNDTQAAQFLYGLSTGTDRVSLVDVMRQLRTARKKLAGNGTPGYLVELLRRRDAQRSQIEQLGRLTEEWGLLRSETNSLDSEIRRLESNREKLKRRTHTMEIAAGLRPKWTRRELVEKELQALGPAPTIPKGIFDRLRSIDDRIRQREQELKNNHDRRELLVQNEKTLAIRDGLQRNAARVKALIEQRSWIGTLDDEVRRLESRREETEFEIHAELERLGINAPDDGSDMFPSIDADTLSALRGPARAMKSAKQKLDHAKRAATQHKANAERLASEMAKRLGGKADWLAAGDRKDVDRMMEKTGQIAKSARRRVDLARDVRAMASRLDEIDESHSRLLELQFQPRPVIVALACVFGLGAILVLSSIFGAGVLVDESHRMILFVMGMATCIVGVGVKLLLDGTHRDVLMGTDSERQRLTSDIADAEEEIAQIDATLPPGTTFEQFLDSGDGDDELDDLVPLDTERRHALDRAALAERQAIEIATSMKDARAQWEKALTSVRLPSRLTPGQVEQLAGRTGNLQFLRKQFHDVDDQLERARRELGTVHNRIVGLIAEAQLDTTLKRPIEQLEQLGAALREQEALVERRSDLRRQTRELKRQADRLNRSVRRLEAKRASLLASANATDEADLRQLEERRLKIDALTRQHSDLNDEISATLRAAEDEPLLRRELGKRDTSDFKNRLDRMRSDAAQIEKQLAEVLQHRGELAQQIKSITEDRQLPVAHIRLALIEQQLRDGLARWKKLSATTHLLRRVYKRYEKDRQPETLQHASEYLSRMTNGRYLRIWTPLAEDVLLVDDSSGHSFPIEVLSRGTREQVFLALRLALVAGYARRGVKMPMVLDDVLVNFDIERTVAAAEVLVEFARSGHQMFIFTCHDHIMRVFQDFDAELRDLPRHDNELLAASVTDTTTSTRFAVTPGITVGSGDALAKQVGAPIRETAAEAMVGAAARVDDVTGASFLGASMLPANYSETSPVANRTNEATQSGRVEAPPITSELPTASSLPADTLPVTELASIASNVVPTQSGLQSNVEERPHRDAATSARNVVSVEATPIPELEHGVDADAPISTTPTHDAVDTETYVTEISRIVEGPPIVATQDVVRDLRPSVRNSPAERLDDEASYRASTDARFTESIDVGFGDTKERVVSGTDKFDANKPTVDEQSSPEPDNDPTRAEGLSVAVGGVEGDDEILDVRAASTTEYECYEYVDTDEDEDANEWLADDDHDVGDDDVESHDTSYSDVEYEDADEEVDGDEEVDEYEEVDEAEEIEEDEEVDEDEYEDVTDDEDALGEDYEWVDDGEEIVEEEAGEEE